MSGPERIDVGSLLTIDVDSELRKLTQAQLQGPWQLPAELVRRAIRSGATRVDVELGRSALTVRSVGGDVSAEILGELRAMLDVQRSPQRRHRALSELERTGSLALLAIVGLAPTSLQISSPRANAAGEPLGLTWRTGGTVELQRFHPPGPEHAEVVVHGAKFDRTRAREWLADVARFARVEIHVDGRPLNPAPNRFVDAFSVTRIATPIAATIGLPREGDVARLFLLQDGLISTHLSVPDAPCFEAVIEMRGLAEPTASAAKLRDIIQPMIPQIVAAAFQHMLALGVGGQLPTRDRSRLTQRLLHVARRNKDRARAIARLPLFRGIERDSRESWRERWCDLLALRQSIEDEAGERLLTALFPDQDPNEFVAEGRIWVLDESERALLGELLELGFRQPRRHVEARRGLGQRLREAASLVRGRALLAGLRPGGKPIPDQALTPDERALIVQLRAQLDNGDVAMCTGSGPVRRIGSSPSKLLLPRDSDRVKSSVLAVRGDPAWIYPSLLALLDGREFPATARRRWPGKF